MKKAKEFMDEFIDTWNKMVKCQDVKLNPTEPNYDDFERAFSEEKKIVATYSVDDVPLITMEKANNEKGKSMEDDDFER